MKLTEEEERSIINTINYYGINRSDLVIGRDRPDGPFGDLLRKKFHNRCPNTLHENYDGTDDERLCPHCNSILIKLLDT
jgi:hypothetical protein